MSGFENIFYDLENKGKGALVVEVPLAQPVPDMQVRGASLLIEGGADVIQIPVPPRMPWMYGPLILKLLSSARNNEIDWHQSFTALEAIRKAYPQAELQPVGFYGGIARMGQENYVARCKELGIRAVDVPDYPLIHDNDPRGLAKALRQENIDLVTIIGTDLALAEEESPSYETLINVVKGSTGFIFLLAVAGGRTGARSDLDYKGLELAKTRVLDLQRQLNTRCPLVAVCGISTPQQVKTIVKSLGMHVMFGSAFYEKLLYGSGDDEVIDFVRQMKEAAS